MPKTPDQKLKLTYLIRFLERETDEEHPATMQEIIKYLESNGVHAERKAIYDDLDALERLGYEIIQKKDRPAGYYMASREFELAELKLLVDAVQSSKFISQKKTEDLIKKLEREASRHQAAKLQRQVFNTNRVKTVNESVLYTIDSLHEAIASNRRIAFHYCEWTIRKELEPRHGGRIYEVDPVALIWDDENYYLVAYASDESRKPAEYTERDIRHYRIDKIRDLAITNDRRICTAAIQNFKPAEYVKEHFAMYAGDAEHVKLRIEERAIGVIIDRFGKDVTLIPDEEKGYVNARVRVQVSPLFFGWLSGIDGNVKIVGPDTVVESYRKFLDKLRSIYENE